MWTTNNRARYDRSCLRYPSDLTDDEWALVEPLIPPAKRGGDSATVIMREVVNGLMYYFVDRLPVAGHSERPAAAFDHPWIFRRYMELGWHARSHPSHALCEMSPEALGREASPTAAIIDSQSVKSAEKGGLDDPPDTMQEKRSRARNVTSRRYARPADPRHRDAADLQDRDGGALVMATLFGLYPFLLNLYADSGYQGPLFAAP